MRKSKGTAECDKSIVTCGVGAAQCKNGTIECEKKNKGTTECDKSIFICDVGTTQCGDDIIKCEKKK